MSIAVKFKVGLFGMDGELIFWSNGNRGKFLGVLGGERSLMRDGGEDGGIYFKVHDKKIYLREMCCMTIKEFNRKLESRENALLKSPVFQAPISFDDLAIAMIGHGLENIRFVVNIDTGNVTPVICKLDLSDNVSSIADGFGDISLVPEDKDLDYPIKGAKKFQKGEFMSLLRDGSIRVLETVGNGNTVEKNIDDYFNTWFKCLNTVQW